MLGALALVGAYVLTTVLKRALLDPLVTIAMIRSHQKSIQDLEPAIDMQQKLLFHRDLKSCLIEVKKKKKRMPCKGNATFWYEGCCIPIFVQEAIISP